MDLADVGSSVTAGALSVALAASASFLQSRIYKVSKQQKTEPTLESRLKELSKTLLSAARLQEQLSAELQARAATAARLQEEARTAEELVKLNQAERDAVARLVRAEMVNETEQSFRLGLVANALFFVAGAVVSVAVARFTR